MFSINETLGYQAPLDVHNLRMSKLHLEIEGLNLYYKESQALDDISMQILRGGWRLLSVHQGCGKVDSFALRVAWTILLKAVGLRKLKLHGKNIVSLKVDVATLRRRVGMVFQRQTLTNPSLWEWFMDWGLQGVSESSRDLPMMQLNAHLCAPRHLARMKWKTVCSESTFGLSGQGHGGGVLVVARAVAIEPEVLLLDEPTSPDPVHDVVIEELINELKTQYIERHYCYS